MIKSRLLTFIDKKGHFTINFFFATPLLNELNIIHNLDTNAKKFYKDIILSSVHLVTFLKSNENMGFYIDSTEPYFRFKLEMSDSGYLRTLLLPEAFDSFPEQITGVARTSKINPTGTPYTSTIKVDHQNTDQIINQVLVESYQTKSSIELGPFNESIMITKLPSSNIDKKFDVSDDRSLLDYTLESAKLINEAFDIGKEHDEQAIVKFFEKAEFNYISGRDILFKCPCSKERMVQNIFTLPNDDIEDLFAKEGFITTRCDYCNSLYEIYKADLLN